MWLGCGEQGTPVPGEGGRGQSPPALSAMLKALDLMAQAEGATGVFKAEARSHHPQTPEAPLLWAPVLLWERKSAEKPQGPTCKGLMGKEVRQV